jgi:hypothetical protein
MISPIFRELSTDHSGRRSDKWPPYPEQYDRTLQSAWGRLARPLEIGIENACLRDIRAKCFPNAVSVVGCDINPGWSRVTHEDARISMNVGDASRRIKSRSGPDGSISLSMMVRIYSVISSSLSPCVF